ncbi:hypothetical protein ABIF68_005801 [Bradyrhizobium japonicum]
MGEPAPVNPPSTIRLAVRPVTTSINRPSTYPRQIYQCFWRFAVDLLVFEFLGLALVAMCVVVVALPCARKSSHRIRYE